MQTLTTSQRTGRAWAAVGLALVVALHVTLAWLTQRPGVLTGQDDAEYISLAQSLREGSYREPWRVDAPVHSQYPPGYPAMLAVWGALMGDSFGHLAALTLVLSGLTLVLTFDVLRRRFDLKIAGASVLVLAVNPAMVRYGGNIASELPYIFLSVACLACLSRMEEARSAARASEQKKAARSGTVWLVVAALAAIFAALTRTVGVALAGAVALHLLLERRWKAAAVFGLACLLTIGVWLGWTTLAAEQFVGRSYVADIGTLSDGGPLLSQVFKRVIANVVFYVTQGVPYSLAVPSIRGMTIDNVILMGILGAFMLVGIFVSVHRWRGAMLYVLTYGSLLLLWTWRLERFVVPLLAFLVPLALVGGTELARRLLPRQRWSTSAVLALVVVLLGASGSLRSLEEVTEYAACERGDDTPPDTCISRDQHNYFTALRFIDSELPADAVFMTIKSGALFYYTGRRSITVEGTLAQSADDLVPFLREQGAEYVLLSSVDDFSGRMPELLEANCESLEIIRSFTPRTLLLRLRAEANDPGSVASDNGCAALESYRRASSARS